MALSHSVRMQDEPKHRLQEARRSAGYETPSDAARAFRDINLNTIISHENGNRAISRKAAQRYAAAFNVEAGWILYGDRVEVAGGGLVKVPLLSLVSAGNLRNQDSVTEADIERWINVTDLPSGDWIALGVDGDSMNLIAPHGSTILVNRADDRLLENKFYVFSLGVGDATFKRYRRKPLEVLQPYSTNTEHVSIPVPSDLYVFGRVRRILIDV